MTTEVKQHGSGTCFFRCLITIAPVWVASSSLAQTPERIVDSDAAEVAIPDGPADSDEPSVVGCGKAHAMIAGFRPDLERGDGEGGVAEAMGETDVLHYDLNIEVSNLNTGANSCTITGSNRMTVQSKSPSLTQFTIRLRSQYSITSALINDTTPVSVVINSTTTRTVTLDRAYAMDEVFTLTIAYTGTTTSVGLGSFQVSSHAGTPVVSTLSEPYYSYSWWPVKDGDVGVPGDNSDKALLDIRVTAPNNYSVASNGLLQSVQTLSGNRKTYHWASDYPIATYLVSFAATNYTTWSTTYNHPGGSMPVEYFIYPENDNPTNRAGWELVTSMMTAFRPLYGEYPFINEKYGLYNFPFGGGMEHQTMTGQSSFGQSLTAHELAHQWWGDDVTCKTWSDIWLNEGFATYGECLWEEFKTGTQNPTAYFSAILARKPSSFGDSVYIPAAATSDANRIFSSNYSYRKGAWVLHMLRRVVGDATFFEILQDYRTAFQGKAATTDDFRASASATFGQDLTGFFNQWVYQIGAPSYRFGWDAVKVLDQDYLHVTVAQLQALGYPNVFTMPIDLVATIGGSPQTLTVQNNQRTQRFVLPVSGNPTLVQFDPNQWILRTSLATTTLKVGDLNGDLTINDADLTAFGGCYTGSGGTLVAGCENADFDGDGDIDCLDFEGFKGEWPSGGDPPQLAQCAAGGPVPAASQWGLTAMALLTLIAGTVVSMRRTVSSNFEH